jgi:hypothetical protein
MIDWALVTLSLGVVFLVALAFSSKRKNACGACGHREEEHCGEIQLAGPEPISSVCLGDDFCCPCMQYQDYV